MQNKNTEGILLQNNGKPILLVKKNSAQNKISWMIGESEDSIDLENNINKIIRKLLPVKKNINTFVGFMINFKKDFIVFKVKDMTKKRHAGARCDQSGKNIAIKVLNNILEENKYTSDSDIQQREVCVLQEFTLRLFNKEKKNNKIWFLDSTEAVLINIEKESF